MSSAFAPISSGFFSQIKSVIFLNFSGQSVGGCQAKPDRLLYIYFWGTHGIFLLILSSHECVCALGINALSRREKRDDSIFARSL